MENQITNIAITRIQNVPSVEPQFLAKVDDQLSYCGIKNAEIKLWDLSVTFRSYGHWIISVIIMVDGEEIKLTKLTTDSQLVDRFKDDEDAEVHMDAFMQVLDQNDELLMEKFEQA